MWDHKGRNVRLQGEGVLTTSKVQTFIEDGSPGACALVKDRRGTGNHIKPLVIAAKFEDRSLVEQHRLM